MPKKGEKKSSKKADPVMDALTAISVQLGDIAERVSTLEQANETFGGGGSGDAQNLSDGKVNLAPIQVAPIQPGVASIPVAPPSNDLGEISWTGGLNSANATPSGTITQKGGIDFMPESMIPSDFIQAKNNILGENFKLSMGVFTDRPDMYIEIVVPQEVSNMMPTDTPREDRRSRAIPNNLGLGGVTVFLNDIAANLRNMQVGQKVVSLK